MSDHATNGLKKSQGQADLDITKRSSDVTGDLFLNYLSIDNNNQRKIQGQGLETRAGPYSPARRGREPAILDFGTPPKALQQVGPPVPPFDCQAVSDLPPVQWTG